MSEVANSVDCIFKSKPASFTIAEFADALGKEIGKPVKYVAVPISAARESMVGMGMDPWIADGYMELLEDFANNWGDKTSRDAETLLGHPARGYQEFCVDFKTAFAAA